MTQKNLKYKKQKRRNKEEKNKRKKKIIEHRKIAELKVESLNMREKDQSESLKTIFYFVNLTRLQGFQQSFGWGFVFSFVFDFRRLKKFQTSSTRN